MYTYQTSDIFLQKKTLKFYFNTRNHFRDELLDLLSIPGCLQLLKMLICSKQLSFIDLCILHFAVESALKFSLHILWKMVLLVVHDFQNCSKFRTL